MGPWYAIFSNILQGKIADFYDNMTYFNEQIFDDKKTLNNYNQL